MKTIVLIGENEPRCYSRLRNKLIADSCEVFQAASLPDAFEHFDLKTADLLLVDLDVPSDRLRKGLAEAIQSNPRIRIIGVTERSDGSEIALRERLDGVAEKPLALGNLLTFVQELLRDPSPWRQFRYLPPRMPGLHAGACHRPHHSSHSAPACNGWGKLTHQELWQRRTTIENSHQALENQSILNSLTLRPMTSQ